MGIVVSFGVDVIKHSYQKQLRGKRGYFRPQFQVYNRGVTVAGA